MRADREDEIEGYPDIGFSDGDFSDDVFSNGDFWKELEQATRHRDEEENVPSRSGNRDARRNAQSAGQHQAAGRHAPPERRQVKRQPAASESKPAPPPPEQRRKRRRPVSRKRRVRHLAVLLILLLAVTAVYVAANVVVFRVKGFQVASAAVDRQVLSWEKSRSADGYDIYDGSGTLLAKIGPDEDAQYVADGLEAGTRYTYTIVAVKNFFGRHTSRAAECSAYTTPEAVEAVTAMNSGTGALLRWEDNNAAGYEVQYTGPSGMPQTVDAGSGGEGFSISGLQEGAQYTFQVRSYLQDGETRVYSDWSSTEPITAMNTVDMTGIDIDKPMVALTFDDGPDYADITERILTKLEEYGAHATFFQIGVTVSELPELTAHIAEKGHEIACHTYDHSHYGTDVTADDIVVADDLIEQAVGRPPSAFRSPGGMTTDLIRQVCASENMPIFYWSIDTEDWKSRDADKVCDAVIGRVSDGDIILMHNVYTSTADAVDRIVPYLAEEGYQMVTVSQLVLAKTGKPPVPGTQYVTATVTN